MLKKGFDLILFGSIFLAICVVALCIETNLLLHLRLNPYNFYLFVFGATLVQYNLHYLYKKTAVTNSRRLLWTLQNKSTHKILIAAGIVFIVISLFSFRFHHFVILMLFGIIASLYSFPILPFKQKKRIKDFGFLKIFTLALLWTLVTAWFPADDANFSPVLFKFILVERFIFIFLLCLLFDMRDIEADKAEDISTISIILGVKKTYLLCYILLLLFAAISIIQFVFFGDHIQLTAMLVSATATFFIIQLTRKKNADFVYLIGVDGMMFLQALLVIFVKLIH